MSDGLERKISHPRNMLIREVNQEQQQNLQVTLQYSSTFVDHTKYSSVKNHIQVGI